MVSAPKIGVLGAGTIGCYVGGRLAACGADVVLVGRERVKSEVLEFGLTLTDLSGQAWSVAKERIAFSTDVAALGGRDLVLCCVKSAQTDAAASALARVLDPGAIVTSLQNGMRNPQVLRRHLTRQIVLGGIVGFNVMSRGKGTFHRATTGPLVFETSSDARAVQFAAAATACGFEVEQVADIVPLQWAKLMMNLNNGVSALSDVPTRDLLLSAGYRRVLGALIEEALLVLKGAGIRPGRLGPLPVTVFPWVLRLPTFVVRLVARAQLQIDAEARSSMWEDLARGRLTEVEELNGEIVRLAEARGFRAPLNHRMVELVHQVEATGQGSPGLSAEALWAALTRS